MYLIGDRKRGETKVFWRPEGGEYRSVTVYKPGEILKLAGDLPAEVPVDMLLRR